MRYSAWENSFPMFFRSKNKELDGYLVDIVELLETRTIISFQYVESTESPLKMLQEGAIDMLPLIIRGVNTPDWMYVSEPYLTIKYINVAFKGAPINRSGIRGVLFSENDSYGFVRESIFDFNSKSYTNLDKLIADLKSGAIQSAYIREDMLNYILAHPEEARFSILSGNEKKIEFSVGIKQSRDDLKLYVDEILNNISPDDVLRMKNSYAPIKVTYGYDKTAVSYLFVAALFGISLLLIIFFLWHRNIKLVLVFKKKEIQRSRDELLFLQRMVDALPNLVCIHDRDHRLLLSNYAFKEGNLGLDCTYHGQLSEQEVCSHQDLDEVLVQHRSTRREITISREGQPAIILDCYRTAIASTKNGEKYVLTVMNDITEFKNQQQELLLANETAQCAVASRERFLASVSHELRTPIAGMVGLLEMLKLQEKNEDSLFMISNVITSARHLHLLVNDILDFSKLEAQQFELDIRESFVLRDIGELLRVHCRAAQEKGVAFHVHWAPTDIQVVKIDPLRVAQIMNNILSNAIKFTSVGQVSVDVSLNEQTLDFCFTDTGEGMSPELLDNVFNPFVQADSTIARRYGGTGLGLAIVHDLLQVMGGEITIESTLGEGTTIRVTIPHQVVRRYSAQLDGVTVCYSGEHRVIQEWLAIWNGKQAHCSCAPKNNCISIWDEALPEGMDTPSDLHVVLRKDLPAFRTREGQCIAISLDPFFADLLYDILVNAHEEVTGELAMPSGLKGRILVAEDNPINQLVMRRQLVSFGLDVDVVNDGREAYEKISMDPECCDLLITDCHMPHLDGYELVNKLRETIPEFADKAIIGCTAEDSRITSEKASAAGFDEILYKPYSLSRLHSLLAKYLSSSEEASDEESTWWHRYDSDDAIMLVEVYIDTMSEDLQLLRLAQNDQKKVHQIAHRIKGGASSVGEETVYRYAQELEALTTTEGIDYTEPFEWLVNSLEKSITAAKDWFAEQQ
nr:ATP-binding protein [Vibrio cincinnatiensis]